MFRKEAIAAKRQKLHGGVFLVQPLSFSALGLLILSIVIFGIILLVTGSYARSEHVIGHLVPTRGLVKIQAARFGTLQSIHVREGDAIKTGQKLAAIMVSTSALDGASIADKALAALARQEIELQTQIALQTNQLEAETARLIAEKEALALRVRSLRGQLVLQRQLASSAEDAFNDIQNLLMQGYISKEESERRHQEWLTQKTQQKFREQELIAAKSEQKLIEIRLLQLPNESKQRVARLMAQHNFALHLVIDATGDADASRVGQTLKARGNIYPITIDVLVFDNNVTDINANPKGYPLVIGHGSNTFCHCALHVLGEVKPHPPHCRIPSVCHHP